MLNLAALYWEIRKCEKNQVNTNREHNINEDAEMDTGKSKKISHQKCYHLGKGAHKAYKYVSHVKKRLSWFGHVQPRC